MICFNLIISVKTLSPNKLHSEVLEEKISTNESFEDTVQYIKV